MSSSEQLIFTILLEFYDWDTFPPSPRVFVRVVREQCCRRWAAIGVAFTRRSLLVPTIDSAGALEDIPECRIGN
jgi:hypothetical protein